MANNKASSRTQRAISLIANENKTPYAAAKECKIALSTIYRALKRKKENEKAGDEKVNATMET